MVDRQPTEPKRAKRKNKQAVIVIHGMGEQVPMQTLRDFVDVTWASDDRLIARNRPDSNTGGPRLTNPTWSKPDERNRSFELRRITTERTDNGRRTDFYEFYWAHLMHGTTWEHFKSWILDLLWRAPRRVPKNVFAAWIALWIITLAVAAIAFFSLLPVNDLRQCLAGKCDDRTCDAAGLCWTWLKPAVGAIVTIVAGTFVNIFLLKYFGDVARYVKPTPLNVARRQDIRDRGVELLETLMGVDGFDPRKHPKDAPYPDWKSEYDRIIVVAHSLGTIVAYDILKHAFARVNQYMNADPETPQPECHDLEHVLRTHIANGSQLDLGQFRAAQKRCREELNSFGSPWIVSDFVTLGSPLTHAEFLMAYDEADLRAQQEERILPTCPPRLEWDRTTELQHFTYRAGGGSRSDDDRETLPRYPHHAAHFAFTRWTNIYSTSSCILWGDLISGPLADEFALRSGATSLKGIRDIAVLPRRDEAGAAQGSIPFFTHTKYWDATVRTGDADSGSSPFHIEVLREALDLLDDD